MQLSILARFEGEFFLKARQKETNSKKKKEKLKFNRFIEKTMKISNKGYKNNEKIINNGRKKTLLKTELYLFFFLSHGYTKHRNENCGESIC